MLTKNIHENIMLLSQDKEAFDYVVNQEIHTEDQPCVCCKKIITKDIPALGIMGVSFDQQTNISGANKYPFTKSDTIFCTYCFASIGIIYEKIMEGTHRSKSPNNNNVETLTTFIH